MERPHTLPAPCTANSPANNQTVDAVGVRLLYTPSADTNFARLEVLDDSGIPVWTVLTETKTTSIELPDLSIGGLEPSESYVWRVHTRKLDDFDYDRHLTDDLIGKASRHTTSAPATFQTQ